MFFCMPCTVSTGAVLTKAAGGNFALGLLMTVTGTQREVSRLYFLHTRAFYVTIKSRCGKLRRPHDLPLFGSVSLVYSLSPWRTLQGTPWGS